VNTANLLLIRIDSLANPFFANIIHNLIGNTYVVQLDIGDNAVTQYLNLFNIALVDGIPQPLSWYADCYGLSVIGTEVRCIGFNMYFYWPIFTNQFYYDPDLSVLVADQPTNDNGNSDLTTILVAVLVPTLTVGVLVVIVVGTLVTLVLMRKRLWHVRQRMQTVGNKIEHGAGATTPV